MKDLCKHEPADRGVTITKDGDKKYMITEVYCRKCGVVISVLKKLIEEDKK